MALLLLPCLLVAQPVRAAALDAMSADGWHTWQVPAAEGASAWCCVQGARDYAKKGCDLDGDQYAHVNCGGRVLDGGHVQLYAKIEAGALVKLRVMSSGCPVYAGAPVANLGTIATEDTSDWLRARMREHDRAGIRAQAAFALAQTGADGSEQAIMQAMVIDRDRGVREEAVFALSQLPGERAVDALLDVVEDRRLEHELRKTALFWLVQSESDRAFTAVERLLGQAPSR